MSGPASKLWLSHKNRPQRFVWLRASRTTDRFHIDSSYMTWISGKRYLSLIGYHLIRYHKIGNQADRYNQNSVSAIMPQTVLVNKLRFWQSPHLWKLHLSVVIYCAAIGMNYHLPPTKTCQNMRCQLYLILFWLTLVDGKTPINSILGFFYNPQRYHRQSGPGCVRANFLLDFLAAVIDPGGVGRFDWFKCNN